MGKLYLKYVSVDFLICWFFVGLMNIFLCIQIWKIYGGYIDVIVVYMEFLYFGRKFKFLLVYIMFQLFLFRVIVQFGYVGVEIGVLFFM